MRNGGDRSPARPAGIDREAVSSLRAARVSTHDKALPPDCWGLTVDDVVARRLRRSQLPTPLLTLSERDVAANLELLSGWVADRGLHLAPHGKTTMAPQLWARQLAAGAWGITLANLSQLAVARSFAVGRVMVANLVLSPLGLRWLAAELARADSFSVSVWADSVAAVRLMDEALAGADQPLPRPLDVLVELGGPGGRTGARDLTTALEVARAIAAAQHLRLVGVAGYEGALAHDSDPASLAVIRDYLSAMVAVHEAVAGQALYPADVVPVVTAGGSAYFDVVAEVLGPLAAQGVEVVLRSGAYLVHDDGFYRHISPVGERPRTSGGRLTSAMHGWVRVTSQPEPGTAIFDAGKRDLPFDEGLPTVQRRFPVGPAGAAGGPSEGTVLEGVTVSALNDQHGFLSFPADRPAPVVVGDELRLGLSHPCTAFDKWGLIPVLDDAAADDPVVVDLIRTYF
ncbi:amino acid deaminase [Angustibacter sp. McL0619]|uniref:amino acid deaminase n=1 Tax=Angustibacter sp. McL0619 TaxID=3415676 RepID=UPI003CEBD5EB